MPLVAVPTGHEHILLSFFLLWPFICWNNPQMKFAMIYIRWNNPQIGIVSSPLSPLSGFLDSWMHPHLFQVSPLFATWFTTWSHLNKIVGLTTHHHPDLNACMTHSLELSMNGICYNQDLLEQSTDRDHLFTWSSLWIPRHIHIHFSISPLFTTWFTTWSHLNKIIELTTHCHSDLGAHMTHLLEQSAKLLGPWLLFPAWLTMCIDIYVFIPIKICNLHIPLLLSLTICHLSNHHFSIIHYLIWPTASIILPSSSHHTCPSTYTMSATFCCLGLNSIQVLMSLLWSYLANSFLAFSYSA